MILGIDTLTPRTTISVGSFAHTFEEAPNQAEALMGCIAATLDAAQKTYQDLTGVLVFTGPGSFTGLRVGLSAAQGIAQGLDIPVFGVTVPEAFALCVPSDRDQMLLIDSRRIDLAVATRRKGEARFSELVETGIDEIATRMADGQWTLLGNGVSRMCTSTHIDGSINPRHWIGIDSVMEIYFSGMGDIERGYRSINADPYYLRAPDVTISRKKFEHQSLYNPTN